EDGIRDRNVTGVQTCALPISPAWPTWDDRSPLPWVGTMPRTSPNHRTCRKWKGRWYGCATTAATSPETKNIAATQLEPNRTGHEIGRASCRERVERTAGARNV